MYCLRLYGSAERNRWVGGYGAEGSLNWTRSPICCFCSATDGGIGSRGSTNEARQLMPQQYHWLMEWLKVEQPKAHRRGMTCI